MKRWAAAAILTLLWVTPTSAKVSLVDQEGGTLTLGGYARLFSAHVVPGLVGDETTPYPSALALEAALARLELKATFGDHVTLDVQGRLAATAATSALSGASSSGLGITPSPSRSLDTTATLYESERAIVEADLDRLSLGLFFKGVDIFLGRQAISWGATALFPVTDIWTPISPFDLDTSQRRGLDAARLHASLSPRWELEAVLADRGSLEDLSGGLRIMAYLDELDLWVGVAKVFEDLSIMGALRATVDILSIRLEVLANYDLERSVLQRPKATVGVDLYPEPDWAIQVELHYQGVGAEWGEAYSNTPELERGESFLLGQVYGGITAHWRPTPLSALSIFGIVNPADPSALLGWRFTYDVWQDVEFGVGAFHGVGERFKIIEGSLQDEFGAYGHQIYLHFAAFL